MKCYITKDEAYPVFYLEQKFENPWYNGEVDIPEELYAAYVNAETAFNKVQKQLRKIWDEQKNNE